MRIRFNRSGTVCSLNNNVRKCISNCTYKCLLNFKLVSHAVIPWTMTYGQCLANASIVDCQMALKLCRISETPYFSIWYIISKLVKCYVLQKIYMWPGVLIVVMYYISKILSCIKATCIQQFYLYSYHVCSGIAHNLGC
jgi:hypothetical protein